MRIGVDLGGTKIEAIALDDDGTIAARRRIATPVERGYGAIIEAVTELVRTIEREAGCPGASVGVGTPGALSPSSGLLRNSNTVCLNGKPLDRDLAASLGRPIRIANDANCFALSEAIDGAGAGADVVFGVILGTGTGGGVVVGGRVLTGRHAIAGEWGHLPLPWPQGADEHPGPSCYCGRKGCVETFLSGPGMARDHRDHGGEPLDAAEIVRRAEAGDPACAATFGRWLDRLARALAVVVDVLDPDVIVLGGGLSKIARTYCELPERLQRWVFSDIVTTPIVPPRHGDASGVRGAAWLWERPGVAR
jgi:fructokinase